MKTALLAVSLAAVAAASPAQQLPAVIYVDGRPQCPTDLDLRNIETRLSARTAKPGNQTSLRAEQMLAINCRMNGTRYSESDWQRLRAVVRGEQ